MSRKHQLRGVAIGIVIATSTIALVYQSSEKSLATSPADHTYTIDEAIQLLEENNYKILEEANYDAITIEVDNYANQVHQLTLEKEELEESLLSTQNEEDSNNTETEGKSEINNETVYQTILRIEPGMTSGDIAKQLARMNVIDDEKKLVNYILDRELDRMLKIGEFHLTSDMTIEQIAKLITS